MRPQTFEGSVSRYREKEENHDNIKENDDIENTAENAHMKRDPEEDLPVQQGTEPRLKIRRDSAKI